MGREWLQKWLTSQMRNWLETKPRGSDKRDLVDVVSVLESSSSIQWTRENA